LFQSSHWWHHSWSRYTCCKGDLLLLGWSKPWWTICYMWKVGNSAHFCFNLIKDCLWNHIAETGKCLQTRKKEDKLLGTRKRCYSCMVEWPLDWITFIRPAMWKFVIADELWSLMHAIMNFDVATLLKVDRGLKIQKRKSNKLDCKKVWENIHHWSQHWKQWKCHFRVQSTRGDAKGFEILSRFRLHPWLQHIIIYYRCDHVHSSHGLARSCILNNWYNYGSPFIAVWDYLQIRVPPPDSLLNQHLHIHSWHGSAQSVINNLSPFIF